MTLTHGSLFSGVGGFDLGADAAGLQTLWQCEINKQARSVLKKHWPDSVRYEDVREVKGDEIAPVDIISFGSPCQDLSVAGKRAGLSGERSGLFHEAIRIAREMRDATNGEQPRFLAWENVRGALSSNSGEDFAKALEEMAQLGAMDISWRLVNATSTGVPQRRVRIFVVADLGGECAGEVLSQPTRLLWNPSQSREKVEDTSQGIEESSESRGWQNSKSIASALTRRIGTGADDNFAQAGHLVFSEEVNEEAHWSEPDFNRLVSFGEYESDTTASTIQARDYKYPTDLIVYTKGRRAQDSEDYETWDEKRPAPTLNAFENHNENRATVIVASQHKVRRLTPRECERLMGWPDDHTRWADDGTELKDSARYRMIGNGIVAPVAQWLCENIVKAMNTRP
jgi:DNA (cytosine-5)-methyltransferase 1